MSVNTQGLVISYYILLDDPYSDNAVYCVDLALYCGRYITDDIEHCVSKVLLACVYHVLDIESLIAYCCCDGSNSCGNVLVDDADLCADCVH